MMISCPLVNNHVEISLYVCIDCLHVWTYTLIHMNRQSSSDQIKYLSEPQIEVYYHMIPQELFGTEGVDMIVRFLKMNPVKFYSGMGHSKLILSTVDSLWLVNSAMAHSAVGIVLSSYIWLLLFSFLSCHVLSIYTGPVSLGVSPMRMHFWREREFSFCLILFM